MNRSSALSILLVGALIPGLFSGCKKKEDPPKTVTKTVPVLTTDAASTIKQNSATLGGSVTSDGNAAVTARGVCYSLTTGPTIADSVSAMGSGTGVFSGSVSNLKLGTKYYVRAFATNSVGTAYGPEISFTTDATIAPGVIYAGGLVIHVDSTGIHGFVMTPKPISTFTKWGCMGTLLTGAKGTKLGTGAQNTKDIVAGCNEGGISAKLCDNLVYGGYSDWYLPSIDELYLLYTNLVSQNIAGPWPISGALQSSTQVDDDYARGMLWGGNLQNGGKGNPDKIYAYRSF